jgi:hypothetical protein
VVEIEKNVEIQIQCGNPDDICNEYGADILAFVRNVLGPLTSETLEHSRNFEFLVS